MFYQRKYIAIVYLVSMLAIIFLTQAKETSLRKISISDEKKAVLNLYENNKKLPSNNSSNNNNIINELIQQHNSKFSNTNTNGQLESFSSDATGLGDLEAQDELKKMTKRSYNQDFYYNELLKHLIEKRRKDILFEKQNLLRQNLPESKTKILKQLLLTDSLPSLSDHYHHHLAGSRPTEAFINDGANYHKRSHQHQLFALQKTFPATGGDNQLVEPILITRRTEEFLDPQLFNYQQPVDSAPTSQQKFYEPTLTRQQQQPLIGEIGSKVSLLTTRKTQPEEFNYNYGGINYYKPTTRFYGQPEEFYSNAEQQQYRATGPNKISSLLNQNQLLEEDEDDSEPVTSQALISPRPRPRIDHDNRDRGQEKQIEETVSFINPHLINNNYLPRIARAFMRRRRRR